MQVWRIHLRPRGGGRGIDPEDSVKLCLQENLIGIGWPVDPAPRDPHDPDEVYSIAERMPNAYDALSLRSLRQALNALASMEEGDLVWTRDTRGTYYLGRVTGSYRYYSGPANWSADIFSTVPADLQRVALPSSVPGKVVNSFRASRTAQRINGRAVNRYSDYLYRSFLGEDTLDLSGEDIFEYLDAEELEDVLFVFLQRSGYVVFPNGRQADTMSYEYVVRDESTGDETLTQVKTGSSPVDLDGLPEDSSAIVFQPNDRYIGTRRESVRTVARHDLLEFMQREPHLLPDAVRRWMRLTGHESS